MNHGDTGIVDRWRVVARHAEKYEWQSTAHLAVRRQQYIDTLVQAEGSGEHQEVILCRKELRTWRLLSDPQEIVLHHRRMRDDLGVGGQGGPGAVQGGLAYGQVPVDTMLRGAACAQRQGDDRALKQPVLLRRTRQAPCDVRSGALLCMAGPDQGLSRAQHPVIVQGYHVSGPLAGAVQREERMINPAVAVHDIRLLAMNYPTQGGDRSWIGRGGMKGPGRV